jgi:hypothetical protein
MDRGNDMKKTEGNPEAMLWEVPCQRKRRNKRESWGLAPGNTLVIKPKDTIENLGVQLSPTKRD